MAAPSADMAAGAAPSGSARMTDPWLALWKQIEEDPSSVRPSAANDRIWKELWLEVKDPKPFTFDRLPKPGQIWEVPSELLSTPILFQLEAEWKSTDHYVDQGHKFVYVGTFRGLRLEVTPLHPRLERAFRSSGVVCTFTLARYCGRSSLALRFC